MRNPEILLLTDYRGQFYESTRHRGASLDPERMRPHFEARGYRLRVAAFRDVDFRADDYRGRWILYQSSEDPGLRYKDYIEDVLLGLALQGARLIPDFPKFRAHHNKVFMEILRDLSRRPELGSPAAKGFGTLEEFLRAQERLPASLVLKPGSGARSAGVRLAEGRAEQAKAARRLSGTFTLIDWAKNLANRFRCPDYRSKSMHRAKFVAQEFLPGLKGDYKVLVYGEKYYVLYRENRSKGFGASGSGRFLFPDVLPAGLLDFAESVFLGFRVPFASLDIAESGGRFHLIEFQFLSFGNYTLEKSTHRFSRGRGGWEPVSEQPDLEREFAASVVLHIERESGPAGSPAGSGGAG